MANLADQRKGRFNDERGNRRPVLEMDIYMKFLCSFLMLNGYYIRGILLNISITILHIAWCLLLLIHKFLFLYAVIDRYLSHSAFFSGGFILPNAPVYMWYLQLSAAPVHMGFILWIAFSLPQMCMSLDVLDLQRNINATQARCNSLKCILCASVIFLTGAFLACDFYTKMADKFDTVWQMVLNIVLDMMIAPSESLLYLCICFPALEVYSLFSQFALEIEKELVQEKPTPASIQKYNSKYHHLTELVDMIDGIIHIPLGAFLLITLIKACFILYLFLDMGFILKCIPEAFNNVVTLPIPCFLEIVSLSIIGGLIRGQGKLVAAQLRKVKLENMDQLAAQHLNIFMNWANTYEPGLTAAKLFTVDFSTILTAGGTLLTYTIIMLQSPTSEECPVDLSNASSHILI